MSRWLRFLLAILVGVGMGLAYGWLIHPVEYVDTTPDTLRVDYKTDYILMTAEAFQGEGDLNLAMRRLAVLGSTPPAEMVSQALQFAEKAGYSDADLERMRRLLDALRASASHSETQEP